MPVHSLPDPTRLGAPTCTVRSGTARRHLTRVAAAAWAGICLAACGGTDPYAPKASYSTVETTFLVYPLNAAPPGQASALDLRNVAAVRPAVSTTGAPTFDLAIDRVGGVVRYLPPKLVTAALSTPQTGFQLVGTPFDSLFDAPGGTYVRDSAFTVPVGRTVVVQATTSVCTTTAPIYAKLVVDSIASSGGIYVRARIDPNCGFKSFRSGVPTN